MSTINRFEQLQAWQKARVLTQNIYHVTRQGNFAKDFGLCGQLQRASISIMSNIAEGHERSSTKDYLRFLSIARGSCAEVRSQLYVAFDVGYLNESEFTRLQEIANETGRILNGLMTSLERKLTPDP